MSVESSKAISRLPQGKNKRGTKSLVRARRIRTARKTEWSTPMQTYKDRRGITTVNNHLPFVWRVNYLHEVPAPELPEIAHEKARQILQKNLSRMGRWQRS
jgi:hypothetical protein